MSTTKSRPESTTKSLPESQLQKPTTAASMAATDFRGIVPLSIPKKSQCVNSFLHPDTLATQAQIFSLSCFCIWIPAWFGPQQQLLHISLIEPRWLQQGLSSSVQKTFARFTEQVPNRPGARPANELASFRHCLSGCGTGWSQAVNKIQLTLYITALLTEANSPRKLQAVGRKSCHGEITHSHPFKSPCLVLQQDDS